MELLNFNLGEIQSVIPKDLYMFERKSSLIKNLKSDEDYLKELKEALGKEFYETMLVEKDDDILMRFIRFTNYDVAESVGRIHHTNVLLKKYETLLEVPYSACDHIWDLNAVVLFKQRDHLGRAVVYLKGDIWDPDEIDIDTGFRGIFYGIDELLKDVQTQINGIVVIVDCTGIGYMKAARILSKVTLKHLTQLIEIYTGGYPIRVGAIYTVNFPQFGAALYHTMKYIVKKKLRERIHVTSAGPKNLRKYFPKSFLPKSLLGDIPDEDIGDEEIFVRLRKRHNAL